MKLTQWTSRDRYPLAAFLARIFPALVRARFRSFKLYFSKSDSVKTNEIESEVSIAPNSVEQSFQTICMFLLGIIV